MITVEVNKQQEEKPKDIFFQGNLVADGDKLILLVDENIGGGEFSGTIIVNDSPESRGHYGKNWTKRFFTQFTGTITITSK